MSQTASFIPARRWLLGVVVAQSFMLSPALTLASEEAASTAADKHVIVKKTPETKDLSKLPSLDQLRQRIVDRVAKVRQTQEAAAAASAPSAAHTSGTAHSSGKNRHASASRKKSASSPDAHATTGATHALTHWDYQGEGGPARWGQLGPDNTLCQTGQRQSPIDIRGGVAVNIDPIHFNYNRTSFQVLDNGHTIQVKVGAGQSIQVGVRSYQLVQFHFHRPSEELINGRRYDMVAHLVHQDDQGKLAVVAVLIESGEQHPLIQQVWANLPLEKNEWHVAAQPIDLNQLLPKDQRYYTYMGSLTTPPCSEGVLWMVLKTPVQLSPEQINVFAHLYPMNARPIQPQGDRLIKESE